MQPRGDRDDVVAQGAIRQGIRHVRLDLLSAARTPIAMDRVFGRFDLQVFGNVFDDASAGATGAKEFATAIGATRQFVRLLMVDDLGSRPGLRLSRGNNSHAENPYKANRP